MAPDPTPEIKNKEELARLIRSRGCIKGRLTKFSEYLDLLENVRRSDITSVMLRELDFKMRKVESSQSEFYALQNQIELLCDDLDYQINERDIVETKFCSLLARAQEILETSPAYKAKGEHQDSDSIGHGSQCSHINSTIKLPTISLPSFDGNYLQWLEFKDTFESMIHNSDSIPLINKFHYLRSSLSGSAAVIIKSVEFCARNYSVAWQLICDRYNNKNILINNHLKSLYNIENISKESFKALRFIIDHISKHLRSLESLGQPTDKWDTLIIFMVSGKLDLHTSRKWEEYKSNLSEYPTLNEFFSFLRSRADVLETTSNSRADNDQKGYSNYNSKHIKSRFVPHSQPNSLVVLSDSDSKLCKCCNESHYLHGCSKFKQLSQDEKLKFVRDYKLCNNCLRTGHAKSKCQLRGCCRFCKDKHNTLLHVDSRETGSTDNAQRQPSTSLPINSLSAVTTDQVLLCTAVINVVVGSTIHTLRAILDTGSQSSFMTYKCSERTGLSVESVSSININGINARSCGVTERCVVELKSRFNSFSFNVNCLLIEQITGILPNSEVNVSNLKLPPNIILADPNFFRPSEVDVLLGADVYWDIVEPHTVKLGNHLPVLQNSKLGWLVAGPISYQSRPMPNQLHCNFSQSIRDELEKFWIIDDLPSDTKTYSVEERLCESDFLANYSRLPNGRFSVQMPMKENPEDALQDNFYTAKSCFLSLEKKFNKFPNLKENYRKFIREYADLGHLTPIEKPKFGYYLPHHAVIKEKSETTKLRVVFNASSKTGSGKSLNDIQMIGPVVQSDLISILLRFRQHKYILIGDIEKMYRQIEIDPRQRHLQLILWRDDSNKPVQVMELKTITYGMSCSPFISTRCLQQLAHECQDCVIADVIENDFYIDDLNTGCDTVEDLKHIATGVVEVLNSACMPLRKFRSNYPVLFEDINNSDNLDLFKDSSVLGLNYAPQTDTLQFSADLLLDLKITKRSVLSIICKVFDPLGLLSACIIVAKILLQQLWTIKLDWDDPVPESFIEDWVKLLNYFSVLFQIKIPRRVFCDNPIDVQLHCFVDASQKAYAACVYIRSQDSEGHVVVKLLCAKARVAPIKPITIPRLELCGALLGARLSKKVLLALRCSFTRKVLWTDSTVVLGWVKTPTRDLKTFVCNRVNEINELASDFTFLHTSTDQNPADLSSRGVDPKFLQSSLLWWEGPSFLKSAPVDWPNQSHGKHTTDLPELKKSINCCNVNLNSNNDMCIQFNSYSSLTRLKRVFAYVLRFVYNCRNSDRKLDALGVTELSDSLLLLVKFSQRESYADEIRLISNNQPLARSCKLLSLTPFLDEKSILRVGGRLENSSFDYDKKHPIIIDAYHHLTLLIMRHEHVRLFHAGPQLLLASIRDRFWPVGGRNLARRTTQQCIICTRFRGKTIQPRMGNLPVERSTPTFPFHSCGVDMAGPFMISSRKGKGNRISKSYLCLFVCLSTKAIHLEVVSDLSTEAFILAFRRFISRRGKPSTIFCDNGTNFKGACNEMGKLYRSSRQSLIDFSQAENIKFVFSPAYSPHFGGIWEAGVRSAKFHLKRIAGNVSLTFEELATLFTQIEAILNSRPLTPLSSNPTDPSPLTPGHFLVGRPLTSVPSPPITCKRPTRYQLVEQLRQHFWERWSREFISELQQRTKWRTKQHELKVGDLVILKEENLPPLCWRLARISHLYPGKDGISRVADVHTRNGTLRRAINKMCALPYVNSPVEQRDSTISAVEDEK